MKQMTIGEISPEYQAFVDKFRPKLTTDDCYTPPLVYEAVKNWACKEYGIDPDRIVRPFWLGGDYQRYEYPEGCVVLDNPPFSILSQIVGWYLDRGIPFFLFAPSLTAFGGKRNLMRCNHIVCDGEIVYENGAVVLTAFVTSYGGDVVAQSAPSLKVAIDAAMEEINRTTKATLPKYKYPDNVLTAAMLQKYSKYGVDYKVRRGDCVPVGALDAQRARGKAIYGGGLLLAEKAAAEKAAAEKDAAEKAAAERWQLSDREREIIRGLG